MTAVEQLARSRALWNRSRLDLESDECVAQILDRGSMDDWRALYRLAQGTDGDGEGARRLRERILRIIQRVPLPMPHFWLAALASLPEPPELPDPDTPLPAYPAEADV